MKRRVVITGLGAVTPIGNTVEEFWNGVRKGACGIGTITKFDTAEYKVHLAGEVKGFVAKAHHGLLKSTARSPAPPRDMGLARQGIPSPSPAW